MVLNKRGKPLNEHNGMPKVAPKPKKHFKIQVTILISFLLVLIVTCGLIIFYNYDRTTGLLIAEIESKITASVDNITVATQNQLLPAKKITQTAGMLFQNKSNILDGPENLIAQSIVLLDLYPQISGFYNGDFKGNLLAIRPVEASETYAFKKDSPTARIAKYEVRTINRNGPKPIETFKYLDQNGNVVETIIQDQKTQYYDPRVRPWYQGAVDAKHSYWSDPYAFITKRQVGITSTEPLLDQKSDVKMVLSADITMGEISNLLAKNIVGKNGITFLFNAKGFILGYPDVKKVSKTNANGAVVMATVTDTQNPMVTTAYETFIQTHDPSFTFTQGSTTYIARFIKVGSAFEKDWTLGFIIDRDEFIDHATDTTRNMVIASLILVILAAYMIYYISRNLAKPIESVAEELKLIKNFDIDDRDPIDSHFSEIALMNQALGSMKRSFRDFAKFVPKAVVRKLIQSGEGAERGGRRMHITIMFSDIQSFSSIAEKLPSEKITNYVSDYFDHLTTIILEEQGTIDKYIGDSIMAFWGAPIEMEDHAYRACRSVVRCAHKLEELNQKWILEGKPQFLTRFGIHTGDAVVGNVGSNDRLNYSAFGDSVNLASRLEGVNKAYHIYKLISEETHKLVKEQFICRPVDIVQVVGKTEGMKIYELMDEVNKDASQNDMKEIAALSNKGFKHYLKKEFANALGVYESLAQKFPQDPIAPIFIERCRQYMQTPPPPHWQGIHILISK